MRHIFFTCFVFFYNNNVYAQKIGVEDSSYSNEKRQAGICHPCKTVYLGNQLNKNLISDSSLVSFLASLQEKRKIEYLSPDIFKQIMQLNDSTQMCVFPFLKNIDTAFVNKSHIFCSYYRCIYEGGIHKAYCWYANFKLMFLFYLEFCYFNKLVINDNEVFDNIELIHIKRKARNKKVNYNTIIGQYANIFAKDSPFPKKSPLKKNKLKWVILKDEITLKNWRNLL
jgi:hypothetical protein